MAPGTRLAVTMLALSLVPLPAACRLDYPSADELTFSCERDSECQQDFRCAGGVCVRSGPPDSDAGSVEGGVGDAQRDAGEPDRARPDAQAPDTGALDASAPDQGAADIGVVDASAGDAAGNDAAVDDAAISDTARSDSSQEDAFVGCLDLDGDGVDGFDPVFCSSGLDHCDEKPGAWEEDACPLCVDTDGDRYWTACQTYTGLEGEDCDDSLPSCTDDCAVNSDAGEAVAVPDCVERYCGSDPDDPGSVCALVDSSAALATALTDADGRPGDDFILLGDMAPTAHVDINISGGLSVRQRPGSAVTFGEGAPGDYFLKLTSNGITVQGLTILGSSTVDRLFEVKGVGNRVEGCSLLTFEKIGILVSAAVQAHIVNNVVMDGRAALAADIAGIRVKDGQDNVIVGNLVVQNVSHGVSLDGPVGTTLDHNTVADNGGDGIGIFAHAATGCCFRNNVVSGNGGYGLRWRASSSWDELPAGPCLAPLEPRLDHGNVIFGNVAGECGDCDACGCLPSGSTFWTLEDVDPGYVTDTIGHVGAYCPSAAQLIDAAAVLDPNDPDYDRNGEQSGPYNGAGPDIGGRETGAAACGG